MEEKKVEETYLKKSNKWYYSNYLMWILIIILSIMWISINIYNNYNEQGDWNEKWSCSKWSAKDQSLFDVGGEFHNCDLRECKDVSDRYNINTQIQECICSSNNKTAILYCQYQQRIRELNQIEIDKFTKEEK